MQTIESIILVGDYIKKQIRNQKIMGVSDFLTNNHNIDHDTILFGQGLSQKQLSLVLKKRIIRNEDRNFPQEKINAKKANKFLTHKAMSKNILISEPIQLNVDEFQCELMIDDSCTEMSDHLTGQHIQAMVLIEAARQLNIAVAEKYIISEKQKGNVGFVLHEMQTNFHRYIYPFSVYMHYQINKIRRMPTGHFRSDAVINFYQDGNKCLEIRMTCSVMDKKFLEDKEADDIDKIVVTSTGKKNQ